MIPSWMSSSLLARTCSQYGRPIPPISARSGLIYPLSQTLSRSRLPSPLVSVAKGLSVFFILSKNQFLVSFPFQYCFSILCVCSNRHDPHPSAWSGFSSLLFLKVRGEVVVLRSFFSLLRCLLLATPPITALLCPTGLGTAVLLFYSFQSIL